MLLGVARREGLQEDGGVGTVRRLARRLSESGRHEDGHLGGHGRLPQGLESRARDRPGQRVDEQRGGERGDLRVDLLARMHDDGTVAAVAQRLLGGDIRRRPHEQPPRVVQRLRGQLVVHRPGLGLVGDLDGTAGPVERLGALGGVLVRCSYGVRPSGALGGSGPPGPGPGLAGLLGRPGAVLRAFDDGLGRRAELAAAARTVRLVRGGVGAWTPPPGWAAATWRAKGTPWPRVRTLMARPCVELESAAADATDASAGSGCATRGAGRSGGSGAVAGCGADGAAWAAGAAPGTPGCTGRPAPGAGVFAPEVSSAPVAVLASGHACGGRP